MAGGGDFVSVFRPQGQNFALKACPRAAIFTGKISGPGVIHQSVPSLTIPPGNPRGFAHPSSVPLGSGFRSLVLPGACPGALKSK